MGGAPRIVWQPVAVGATVREGVDSAPAPSLTVAPTATFRSGQKFGDELQVGSSPNASSMPLRLERQTQSELNIAAFLAAAGQDSLVGGDGRIRPAENVSARIDEHVGVVEEVEELGAELQVHALARELEALVQPEVEGPVPRRAEKVARREKLRLQVCYARRASRVARAEVIQSAESAPQACVEVKGVREGRI